MDGSIDRPGPATGPTEVSSASQNDHGILDHSTMSFPGGAADADEKSLNRQKRKRTSAEDQAVLEAAYKENPKPDKAARLELVRHVALGEKEVQIWFQNRRQSSRRKSRPLLPHEIAQYQLSRSTFAPQSPEQVARRPFEVDAGVRFPTEAELRGSPATGHAFAGQHQNTSSRAVELHVTAPTSPHPIVSGHSTLVGRQMHMNTHTGPILPLPRTQGHATPGNSFASTWPAHLRIEPQPRLGKAQEDAPPNAPLARLPAETNRGPKRISSCVRLSLSFEGNATITTKDGSSPSPPRASQVILGSVHGIGEPLNASASTDKVSGREASRLKRTSSGRSRDSRTWEFWCDKDVRNELEDKAETESSGSAVGAIGLLRSASGRSILGPLPAKLNPRLPGGLPPARRVKLDPKRSGLQRSHTSSGRLKGKPTGNSFAAAKSKTTLKHTESALSVYIPGNDSDKENWSPNSGHAGSGEMRESSVGKTGLPTKHGALSESRTSGYSRVQRSHERSFNDKAQGQRAGNENVDPEGDAEVAAFMRGERKSSSSEDDLDCVQGLLSLSQGNWR